MIISKVPTGDICIMQGERNKPLEFLSIGDYGKQNNIKADFLGLPDEIHGVPNGDIMPLSEKWVITISSQYGCSMGCTFCDVPKVGKGVNATEGDLDNQIIKALELHPEIKHTKRLNIHYARMGEPTFNQAVLGQSARMIAKVNSIVECDALHPVISTMMPIDNNKLKSFVREWCHIKNDIYKGNAGLQLSINSTDEHARRAMFNGRARSLNDISNIMDGMPSPVGRKYTLNFALSSKYDIDAKKLSSLFDSDKFMVKITPMHITKSCLDNDILTRDGYSSYAPYKKVEEELKSAGFDVLVFIPSIDEDKSRITCGNAILSMIKPKLSKDGNMYCYLLGSDLMKGTAGFGETPYKAMIDFNNNYYGEQAKDKDAS